MAKKCPRCGASLKFWSKTCKSCGAPPARPVYPSTSRRSRSRPWIFAGAGVLLVAGSAGLFLLREEPSNPKPSQAVLPAPQAPPPVQHIAPPPSPVSQQNTPGPTPLQPRALEDRSVTKKLSLPSEGKKTDPQSVAELAIRAGLDAAWAGRLEEAARLFEKAVRADPENITALNNLGLARRKLGRIDEAIKAYRRVIEIDPSFALAYKNLGIALEQKGNKEGAVKAYRKYAELNPSAPDIKLLQETIVRLKSSH
jgi:tetratricopeptide (TPR) repeat protein